VNVYDPADRMIYVHLAGPAADRTPAPADRPAECHRLPAAYANQSPRTLLRSARMPRADRLGRLLQSPA
jgi:hypothetical protein